MGFQPVQAVLRWAEGIIQIYTNPSGIMELPDDDPGEYHSLYEALAANGISTEGLAHMGTERLCGFGYCS